MNSKFYQHLEGSDAGFSWPIDLFDPAHSNRFFMLVKDGDGTRPWVYNINEYMENDIVTVTGWDGKPTRVLYESLFKGGGGSQNWNYWYRGKPVKQLYIRYRLKYQKEGFIEAFHNNDGTTNIFFFKSSHTDYRIEPRVVYDADDDELYWRVGASGQPNGTLTEYQFYWTLENHKVPVPLGKWFMLEIFFYRSTGSDGRFFMAVDGRTVFDYHGPMKKTYDIDRIGIFGCYGRQRPHYQWVDDVEIWDNFPCTSPSCVVK